MNEVIAMPKRASQPLTKSSKLTPLQLRRKIGLLERGVTAADIGRDLGKSRQAVTMVLLDQMRSREIELRICEVLGEKAEDLFPLADGSAEPMRRRVVA